MHTLSIDPHPLSHAERQALTQSLLDEAATAPDETRRRLLDRVVEINLRVARAVARRYAGRGVPAEDLEQAACEGLVKAVQRYDASRQEDLLTFAVPTIRGEVLRYFRDHSWSVRPPRRVQELQPRLRRTADDLLAASGREPTDLEVRTVLGVSRADQEEAAAALGCFTPTSLDQPSQPGSTASLGDLLPEPGDEHGPAEARALLRGALGALDQRQRDVVYLRYFEELTQGEIGREMGVTQATVSRWLKETLEHLRGLVEPEPEPA